MSQENPLNLKIIQENIRKAAELFAEAHNLGCQPETLECLPACGVLKYAIANLYKEAGNNPHHPALKQAHLLEALQAINLARNDPYQIIDLLTHTKLLSLIQLANNGGGY